MTGKLSCNIKFLVLSLLLLTALDSSLFAQVHSLTGQINNYGRVTTIGTDNVIISDPTEFSYFHAGDTVLLIQMKGAKCLVDDLNHGEYQISDGTTGAYEFLTVLSVGAGNKVTFRNNIINTYSLLGDVQLVRVPSFNAAKVDAAGLNCQAWDSTTKTGGVLALFVGTKLTLNANVDAKAKGFRGGNAVIGLGNCTSSGGGLNNFFYPDSWQNSGLKGESLVSKAYISGSEEYPIYPGYAKGYGQIFTGGGGGNGRFSGGGGGSLIGSGGKGGLEISTCPPTQEYGGLGGYSVVPSFQPSLLSTGLFLGGGGGGSTYLAGATPSSGGRGGGIVIIVCETFDGNGYSILAEGEKPAIASGNAGSGGGGGGGTIALYLSSFTSNNITLSVKGGDGGNNAGNFGEGGGGGGGRLNVSNIAIPGNVTRIVDKGSYGTHSVGGHDALNGTPGENLTTFVPLLNGFLFNSIKSSVTLNQKDSICSNVVPPPITGTDPVGGSGTYSYTWEKKYSLAGTPSIIGGESLKNYTPAATEANTFWVRRIVKDDVSLLTDTSKWVQMIVQPAITGNSVGNDTTICYNQDPHKLRAINLGPSNGNGHYAYQWLSNNDNATWTTNASGTSTLSNYDPAALLATTYYKRKVTSGRCVDNSTTVTITVLSSITGNVTSRLQDSVICQGSLFNTLGASAAGGGSGSYIYEWQDSISSYINFLPAAGTNNAATYSADTSDFTSIENRYYRRVVYSGLNNTCKSKSVPIHYTRYHKIKNNDIAADDTICSGSIPAILSGSIPIQGNLIYSYQWQDSSTIASWTTKWTSQTGYQPAALTETTWYKRIVNSSKCTSTSNKIIITVHKPIANNVASLLSGPGPDTTVCSSAIPHIIKGSVATGGTEIPGDYAYLWSYSTDNISFTDITVSGTLKDYQPVALTGTTWFRRKTISGMCSSTSNSIRVIVLPPLTGNTIVVNMPSVCYNTVPLPITTSGTVHGGVEGIYNWIWQQSTDGITWTTATGTSNQQNYTPPALTVKTWFRRIVNSGLNNCCTDISSSVSIDIIPLPTGIITSAADTTLCSGGQVKLRVTLTGSSTWTLIYNENSTQVTVSGISSANAVISRIPAVTGAMTTFNYSLASVTDNNGCVATSLSGTRKADVYHTPAADPGPDDEVCGPAYKLAAVPSYGTGLWSFPAQVLSGTATDPNTAIKIDSSFSTASVSYWFVWQETNWLCTSRDSVKITFDNRIDTINAGPAGDLMTFDNIAKVDAYPLLSFETGKWSVVAGNGDFEDNTASSTYVRNIAIGNNIYKWSVKNGVCVLDDTLLFIVAHPVIPEAISPDGNNINDTLKITGLDLGIQDAELKILNGAGTMVFTTSNRNDGSWTDWTGKDAKGGLLPEGTYYYLLNVTSKKTGHVSKVSGFIILKRH
jgi:hypothetical protein